MIDEDGSICTMKHTQINAKELILKGANKKLETAKHFQTSAPPTSVDLEAWGWNEDSFHEMNVVKVKPTKPHIPWVRVRSTKIIGDNHFVSNVLNSSTVTEIQSIPNSVQTDVKTFKEPSGVPTSPTAPRKRTTPYKFSWSAKLFSCFISRIVFILLINFKDRFFQPLAAIFWWY